MLGPALNYGLKRRVERLIGLCAWRSHAMRRYALCDDRWERIEDLLPGAVLGMKG